MKNFWAGIILIVVLIGLGLYFSSHVTEAPIPNEDDIAPEQGMIIATTSTARIEDKENRFIATIETPVISGHDHAKDFNMVAKVYVDRATEDFARSAAEANFNIPESFKNGQHGFTAKATTEIINNRYITVLFTREYDMLAAAHPFHLIETLVYDIEEKKVIELVHVFENVDKALVYISSRATEQVKAQLAQSESEESFIPAGAAAQIANYGRYSIDTNGITFYFAEYQVAPYAAGPQQVTLTWQELRPLLTPSFKVFAQ